MFPVPPDAWEAAVAASVRHAFGDRVPAPDERERYVASLHREDLALAAACAAGVDAAWEEFVARYQPLLRRAARAIAPGSDADDLADSLLGDLFGVGASAGTAVDPGAGAGRGTPPSTRSLFRYFHGRSSLSTWLRAVLAQRHIDRIRTRRRIDPMPPDADTLAAPAAAPEALAERPRFESAMQTACAAAIAELPPRDRLRLSCYYLKKMSLAAIGKLLGEHEATTSRHLTQVRGAIRQTVDERLRRDHGMDDRAVAECFEALASDAGALNLADLLGDQGERKNPPAGRSTR